MGNTQVPEDLISKPFRPFAIKPLHEGNALFAGHVTRSNFLGCIVGSSSNTKLDVCGPVVEVVDSVVDAVVLAVGTWRAFGRHLESAMLDGVVITTLGMPLQVVTQIVHLDRSEEHTSELQSLAYLVCR